VANLLFLFDRHPQETFTTAKRNTNIKPGAWLLFIKDEFPITFPKSINPRANFEGEGEVNVEATQNQVRGAEGAQSEESEEDPDPDVQAYKEKQDEMQAKIDDFKANVHPCVPENLACRKK